MIMTSPTIFKWFLVSCVITVQIVNSQNTKRSLVIVFDVTSSMTDEINSLREGVILLLQSFTSRADNPISEYVFVQFRDEEREMVILPPIVETDAEKIYKHLNTFGINGGRNGDCLESCFRGIKYGLELAVDNSIMFVFTDAGTKHKELKPELEKLIQQKKVTLYFFITDGCGREDYEIQYYKDLASSSNGLVFDVDYRQIKEHFPKYREVINDKLGLNSQFQGPAGKSNVGVDVDSSMKEFTFTIVAQKPLITIYDPSQNLIRDFEVLTDLPTIKMIKVKEPEPGKWTVQIEASTPYTGQVSVISDLSFKYGFAVHEPESITQTSFSPLIGQNNYLAIFPSDPTLIRNLEYVVLDTKFGPHKYPLRKKSVAEGDLYVTESIQLPPVAFKVFLHGIDPVNHAIKRLLSPDIASRPPDKPGTSNVPTINVHEGQPIYLICRVDSMIDITISWQKVGQSTTLKSVMSKQSNVLNYTIEESDVADSGDYLCVATNTAGQSESKTVVDVRRIPLNVNAPIKQHTPKSGTNKLILKCVVTPKNAAVSISWLFNGNPVLPRGSVLNLPNLILNNIDRNSNGTYTCVAKRKSEIMEDNIEVNVQYPAKILNIFKLSPYSIIDIAKPIELYDHSDLKILCGHEGNRIPDVKWINQNRDIVSSTSTLVVNGNDKNQAGNYLCQVENTAGKDEKLVQIDITIKPKLLAHYETNYQIQQGNRFSLECPLEVVPNNGMDIAWYQNGSQIEQSWIFNDHIKINKIYHIHNGKYKCLASNKAGVVEAEFNVNVLYKASVLNIVKEDNLGSSTLDPSVARLEIINVTSLTCVVNGNPTPTVVWKRNGTVLANTNKIEIIPVKTGLQQPDGDYLCEVENLVGKDEKYIKIDLTIKPKLHPSYERSYRVVQGDRFSLDCPLEPNNKMDIAWYQNGSQIQQSWIFNDRIKINKVDHIHNGKYKCLASNEAGIVEAEFNVDVQYKARVLHIVKEDNLGSSTLDPSVTRLEVINVTSLTCVVNGNPTPTVAWKRNGTILANTNKIEIIPVKTGLQQPDGDYLCEVENLAGKDEKYIKIDLTIKPTLQPSYERSYRVIQGDRFSLDCPLEPNNKMEIFWYQNGSQIQQSSIIRDSIEIAKLDHIHNGEYKCLASNDAGSVEAKFNVTVLYRAGILNIIKFDNTGRNVLDPSITKLEIFNLTIFTLTCFVNGNPAPTTVWKKNGAIYSRTNQLKINTINTGFSGIYECSTENELNSDERAIELFEIVKPKLNAYSVEQKLIEDNEFRLSCPVESGDYDFNWYFNDNNYDSHKQSDGSLFIDKVYPNMTGRVYCVATNKAGTAVATFDFNVLRPPYGLSTATSSYKNLFRQIAPNTKEIGFVKHEPFDITCNALGNPTPEIYWLKNDQMYSNSGSLDIRSIESSDAATYTCVAENVLGNQTEKIIVIVYLPPYLLNTTGLENGTNSNQISNLGVNVLSRVQVPTTYFKSNYEKIIKVNEGENVVLDCNMHGYPTPTIDWFKNNEILNNQTAELEFSSTKIDNSGIYKCFGNNDYGKMAVIFYLDVQKPLSIVAATSTKSVYEIGEEIKLICTTKGNQLPVIVWRSNSGMTDNENLFKLHNVDLRKTALQRVEPIYLNGKKVIKLSGIDLLERYGKLTYEFVDGEYIGTLEYVLKSAKMTDGGQYKCSSKNYKVQNSKIDKTVTIQVVEAPYVENAETEYSILQGIDAHKIKCPIKGIPTPTIEWYRNGSAILPNQNFDIQNQFVEFKNPMLYHAGEYSCRGTNNGGTVEFKFKVIIFVHIADISNIVLNRSRKTRIEVEKDNTKELKCSIKIKPIYWSKIIDAYPNKQRQLLKANDTYNFIANESEVIMCSKDADPEYGEIFEITVLEKPTIQSIAGDVEVKLDDNLRLQCDATGEPKPIIKWYKYVGGKRFDINNYPEFKVNDATLIKSRAENIDTAKYVCTARNNLGTDSKVFDVIVLNESHYYSPWSEWSPCTKTCNEGIQIRTRDCIHPSCNQTRQREEQKCTIIECAINGGWSKYSPFGQCSKSCVMDLVDVSIKEARRECNNPEPAFGGKTCMGTAVRIVNCTVPLCESLLTYDKLDYSACSNQEICCPSGFVYDNRTGGCPEIDKCQRKGPYSVCRKDSQICQNIGTDDYECRCRSGFKLKKPKSGAGIINDSSKNPNCVDINECKLIPYPCGTKKCSNNKGSYKCV